MRSRVPVITAALITSLTVMMLLGPVAAADTVDISDTGKLPEFDVSYVSDDVLDQIAAEDEQAFVDEMQAQWDHCNVVINRIMTDPGWLDQEDGFLIDMSGACIESTRGRIGGPDYKFASLDINAVADEIAIHTSQYNDYGVGDSLMDSLKRSAVAGTAAADAAEAAGGGEAAQTAAGALGSAASLAGASQGAVNAVTNPTGQVDEMVNKLKGDSGKAITEGLGYLAQGLAFDAASTTFRELYAAAAGVGLVILAAGAAWSFARMNRLGLPPEEAVERVLAGLVCGFLGLSFTPAVLYVCTDFANVLTAGVVEWMGTTPEAITGSLIDPFNALTTANSPLGYLGAIIICILFFIAGVMLIVVFAAQFLTAYFGSVALGVTGGLVATENGRRRHRMAATLVVMTIFAQPIITFMVAVALRLSGENSASADGWSTDPMGTLFKLIIAIGAILMVCFAPAALARFMPVGPSRGGGIARGFAAGLVGGPMGAGMAGSMFHGRMRALSPMIRSAATRAGRTISGQGGTSSPQGRSQRSDAASWRAGADAGRAAQAAPGRGRHAAQPSRSTDAQHVSRQHGQPGVRTGSAGGPVEAPAVPAVSDGGYQSDSATGGAAGAPDTSGTHGGISPVPARQAAAFSRSGAPHETDNRPGSRLSGADLLRPMSPARRLAGGSVRAAGRVGGAAATAAGFAAGTAATAVRIGGYQAANWANNITEDER